MSAVVRKTVKFASRFDNGAHIKVNRVKNKKSNLTQRQKENFTGIFERIFLNSASILQCGSFG